jgi:hypothetical protein
MTEFRCGRFPSGVVPIRTTAGIVHFHDGVAEVDDSELADALSEVPALFEIEQVPDETPEEEPCQTVTSEAPSLPANEEPSPRATELRAWAKANNVPCPAKGRVPQAVVRAYLTRRSE